MSVILLDDRDPAIHYSGTWDVGGDPAGEYQTTATWAGPAPNTFATLTFIGTGVTVIGSIQGTTAQVSSYSIDGGRPTTFTSTNAPEKRFSQVFFTIGEGILSAGVNHTLVMTPVETNLSIDLITVDVPLSSTSVSAVAPTSLSAPSIASSDIPSSTPSGVPQTNSVDRQSNTKLPLGPIIGSVLGGLVLGCAVVLIVHLIKGHKKLKRVSRNKELFDADLNMQPGMA